MPLVAGRSAAKCKVSGKKAVGRKAPKADPNCYQVGTKAKGAGGRVYVVKSSKRWSPESVKGKKKSPSKARTRKAPATASKPRAKSCKIDTKKKQYKKRGAPDVSATCMKAGDKMKGLDGNMYVVKTVKKGSGRTKRWFKA